MHSQNRMRVAILLLSTSLGSCATPPVAQPQVGTEPVAVTLPAPPRYMNACPPTRVKVGDQPNAAFDKEHASLKECSRQGAASRAWYERVRQQYGTEPKS